EQRIPNMKGIMMSKRKPLNLIPVVEAKAHLEAVKYVLPDAKTGVKIVDPDDMEELVRLLHEEAKAI
ncbi:MAG: electron transfer flavoprotein beta subunit/FixA family protein, partial [Saprospiraceae bacterium]|nr:electron transfer flavoprotein beta subunit/FixA family protein [Saprospiraceae bacterium]